MSGLTPAQRLRTKTSDFTDFLRGVGHSSNQARQDRDASTIHSTTLEVPTDSEGGPSKKKITRIPLFGRTRKKSNHSAASSPYASSNIVRDSTDVGEMSSRTPSADRDSRRTSPAPVNTATTPPPSRLPSSSLSSKFAAPFSNSISQKHSSPTARASSSRTSLLPSSSALAPPTVRPSFESGSSGGSRTRSTTPRPQGSQAARPMITVSMTDNMDEFQDLFTREVPKSAMKSPKLPSRGSSRSGNATPSSSPPASPLSRSPEPAGYKRGHTPASALAAAVRDRESAHERQPSTSSRGSRRTPESDKTSSSEKHDGRSTPRMSGARESPRPIFPEREKSLPQSLQRRTSVATASGHLSDSSSRSRIKPPSTTARSKPPSIPLPQIPKTPTPPLEFPPSPRIGDADFSETESRTSEYRSRSRANTIASIPDVPAVSTTPPSPQEPFESKLFAETPLFLEAEVIDIDYASPDDLRRVLRKRNKNFEELAAFMLKKEEEWSVERKALEKKVTALQRDLVRRESEITGLKLIIHDEDILQRPKPLPVGILNHSRLSVISHPVPDSDQEGQSSPSIGPPRRLHYQSDSGAESLRASGPDSVTSILRQKKFQRPSAGGQLGYDSLSRSSSARRAPKLPPGLYEKSLPETPYVKRMSMVSTTSSASSSASSLLPPSPSVTMSSLSAIPEGAASGLRVSSDQEDRRARSAHRVSTSSMTSSSTAASSAYSGNIKRSRPPSIAQVLEKSPNMEDVLEKLRPFA